jgi:DNA-directed RNA polymerase subunit H (RpoH/RPB5)
MTAPKRTRAAKPKGKGKGKAAADAPVVPPRPFLANALTPPHELLSVAETDETLKALGTSIDRLPKILVTDPGLKTDKLYVAAREAREPLVGRLVRVRRPSQTAGEAIAYRVLIQSSAGD